MQFVNLGWINQMGVVGGGLASYLAAIGALLWHSDGTDDHLVDQDGDELTT